MINSQEGEVSSSSAQPNNQSVDEPIDYSMKNLLKKPSVNEQQESYTPIFNQTLNDQVIMHNHNQVLINVPTLTNMASISNIVSEQNPMSDQPTTYTQEVNTYSGVVFNYPILYNSYEIPVFQQNPIYYYYLMQSSLNQNQFVFVNTNINQEQLTVLPTYYSIQNIVPEAFEVAIQQTEPRYIDREAYERFNISFNDAL